MPQPTTTTTTPTTAAERQIARARQLERERSAVMSKISKNREYLRLMADNDELSAEQKRWLAVFYPDKERGEQRSKEQIEATRKAKEAARRES